MRVLICGGRDYDNKPLMFSILDDLHADHSFGTVIEGEAEGADKFAREWAESRDIPVEPYPANWSEYGKAAGPVRNKQMLTEGYPQMVVAFPKTTLLDSVGTKDMVKQAKEAKLPIIVVEQLSDRIHTYII